MADVPFGYATRNNGGADAAELVETLFANVGKAEGTGLQTYYSLTLLEK